MKKQSAGNISISIMSLLLSVVQSVWSVSFFSVNLGETAYGYIAVIASIVNVSTIISLSLTSMTSRFLLVEIEQCKEEANKTFNSILFAIFCIIILLAIVFFLLVWKLECIMQIEDCYIRDVKLLFCFVAGSMLINVLATPFISGVHYENKLYIYYLFVSINYAARIIMPLIKVNINQLTLYDMALGGFVVDVCSLIYYVMSFKKRMPMLYLCPRFIHVEKIVMIIKSGIWTSVTKSGSVMMSTITSYLSNVLLGVVVAGKYAVMLQLESVLSVITSTMVNLFVPRMYENYGKRNYIKLHEDFNAIRVGVNVLLGILCGGICVYGVSFLNLWTGMEFEKYRYVLVLMVVFIPFTFSAEVCNHLLITYNRIKIPALVSLLAGIVNIIGTIICICVLRFNLGGLVAVKIVMLLLSHCVFFPIYTSNVAGIKKKNIYKSFVWGGLAEFTTICYGEIIEKLVVLENDAISFGVRVLITGAMSLITIFIFFKIRKEDKIILNLLGGK